MRMGNRMRGFANRFPTAEHLSDTDLEVFQQILDRRAVRKDQLASETIGRGIVDPRSLDDALKHLLDRNLVKLMPALINQFDTYLVTADGLELANLADR